MDFAIADLEKNKKALAEKQALFLAPPNNFEPLRFRTFMRGFSLTH